MKPVPEIISKKLLSKIFGVTQVTIENWAYRRGFTVIGRTGKVFLKYSGEIGTGNEITFSKKGVLDFIEQTDVGLCGGYVVEDFYVCYNDICSKSNVKMMIIRSIL